MSWVQASESKWAKDEADAAAAEAKKSATAASQHAANAKKSADAAGVSAANAAKSATTARNAANRAEEDAQAAENSAAEAEFSATYARQSASQANDSANAARDSALAAGKSAEAAEGEAKAARKAVEVLREKEAAEARRQAAEERKRQQQDKPKRICVPHPSRETMAPIMACATDPGNSVIEVPIDPIMNAIVWELTGANDVKECIEKPTALGCAVAAVGVLPIGRLKLLSKIGDAIGAVKDYRKTGGAIGCLVRAAHSFPAGTLVLMADGSARPIEEIRIGEVVAATDPASGETAPRAVVDTIRTPEDREFTDLTLEDGTELTSTVHHPFWSATHQQWREAKDLTAGDQLRTAEGANVSIAGTRDWIGRQAAFDLTVSDYHSYYVFAGTTPVLVHNCNGGFKIPVSTDEIRKFNSNFEGTRLLNGSPENAMINAGYYNSFWEKSAVMIRDIAGSHMFDNGNKRTAHEVVSQLMQRNNVVSGPTADELWAVIDNVSDSARPGHTMDIGKIASMLRGF
ncbi:polymorphic toxin-type HINT domain-containing protein [Streptomyces sp. NPDC051546]|uniref:polymorphic toxin-type HINT domain-containing protein n=1 Tax=Streptomyces sp. NPDC051546 TaxID=3365655 RepID=UPI0037B890F3